MCRRSAKLIYDDTTNLFPARAPTEELHDLHEHGSATVYLFCPFSGTVCASPGPNAWAIDDASSSAG